MTVDSSSLEEGMRTSNAESFMSPYIIYYIKHVHCWSYSQLIEQL